ncbi:MAG: nucleotidyltransferase family protein [Henriciella sp.]|nr:nucleotidyltransferase family protein [Henriciella sp.]
MMAAQSFENLVPRQDPEARLLLLTAKTDLSEDQQSEVQALARQVKDWDFFTETAAHKFSATFAHRHLEHYAPDIPPPEIMEKLKGLSRLTGMATLKVTAAQIAFHKACIETTGAQHAYLKGVALSVQYGRNIADRYSRDVDVLVAEKDFDRVIQKAADIGYRILLEHEPLEYAQSAQDIKFVSRYADVVTLLGADFVPIEVHRRMGKLSLNFNLDQVFETAEPIEVSGVPMRTISKALHLVYVSYHHSRHFWSHLHWLADLDSMIRSSDCRRDEVNELADSIGIRPTIDAAFEFHDLISRPSLWDTIDPALEGGSQFLNACLLNLEGGLELEESLRGGMALGDFMSAWQISPGKYNTFWKNSWFRRLRPTSTQYVKRRYPRFLQWIYYLENASVLMGNGFGRARGRPTKPDQKLPSREASATAADTEGQSS